MKSRRPPRWWGHQCADLGRRMRAEAELDHARTKADAAADDETDTTLADQDTGSAPQTQRPTDH